MTSKKTAIIFIVFLGIVSLFADITYEGARSINGPYLSVLGASGAAVGIIMGLGEFLGYGMRFVSGYISDKTRRYWLLTIIGYAINLIAVPLLAFAVTWEIAGLLIILERLGKAIRTPARDTMLSYAAKKTGTGWGFGLHESLDQIGAIIGPLVITALLYFKESYRMGFLALAIPATLALIALICARVSFPRPQELETKEKFHIKTTGFNKNFWLYMVGIGFVALGFTDFALISFHFKKADAIPSIWIPFLYAIAMGVDGLAALCMGRLFDVKGIRILAIVSAFSCLFAPFVFFGHLYGAIIGMVLWGIGLGSQESIMRSVIAEIVPMQRRGSGYGMLYLIFGISWAIGSSIMGLLYDISALYLVIFSVLAQAISIPLFLFVKIKKS